VELRAGPELGAVVHAHAQARRTQLARERVRGLAHVADRHDQDMVRGDAGRQP